MNNNDVLVRIRYALDSKETDMIEMFKLGGVELTREELKERLVKSKRNSYDEETIYEGSVCSNSDLVAFLDGFITFKRGKLETNPEQPAKPVVHVPNNKNINNLILKKIKIALSLTSEEIIEIFYDGGINVTKAELSALFRSENHKNYRECGDKFVRNFLRGLAIKYRI